MSQPAPPSGGGGGDISSELESFRQQWRAEVKAKTVGPGSGQEGGASTAGAASTAPASAAATSSSSQPPQQQQSQVPQDTIPPRGPGRRGSSTAAAAPQTPMKLLSAGKKKPVREDKDDDYVQPRAFDDVPAESKAAAAAAGSLPSHDEGAAQPPQEPQSALEHYEKAVEKEAQGSLGDSLRLYRKAFRMDSAVDKKYKNKHFPAPAGTGAGGGAAASGAAATTAAGSSTTAAGKQPAVASASGKAADGASPPALKDLIASFAGLAIEAAPPPIAGMPQEPCPLARLPDELLVHVLRDVAVADVGDFVRLARVCKKLAYLVATEDRIWRRVCLGSEFGFAAMHRAWQTTIAWGELPRELGVSREVRQRRQEADNIATTLALRTAAAAAVVPAGSSGTAAPAHHHEPVYASWQRMFRLRPRIRFNGCYISTVNYIRAGQASVNLITWNSPVHIVTYFRYLRFFRDGTVISLLTTSEPADVVPHLTKDLLALHQGGAMPHLPSVVMQNAYKGRWRQSGISDGEEESEGDNDEAPVVVAGQRDGRGNLLPTKQGGGTTVASGAAAEPTAAAAPPSPFSSLAAATEAEGDLVVETEGVGKYYYRMELSIRTAGKSTRNNKLNWRGFYSYNPLTDDWAEFGLKNDRPFFFSRVKSYGIGE